MPRRGENIYKRKDGRWEGRYKKDKVNGKTRYGYVYAKSYKEVKERLLSINQLHDTELIKQNTFTGNKVTFYETAEKWLSIKASTIKKSSYVKYNNMLRYYLYPQFKNTFIDEITYENVNNLTNVLLTTAGNKGTGLSPKTVQCVVSLLNQILSYASHYYTDLHLSIPGITVKQEQKVLRVLSPQEQQRLTVYLYDNMELCNLGILVCMYSGLRIGELCALRWENILWNEQCIYVKETMQRLQNTDTSGTLMSKTSIVISAPKSACSIRKIPIPEQLFSILRIYECESSTFLMTGTKSYIEPRTLQYRFKRITEKCNIYDVKFHSLRHTFATRCVELGFDIKSLSEILGHANVNITLNRYVHPSMEQKQKNMNLLSELLIVR